MINYIRSKVISTKNTVEGKILRLKRNIETIDYIIKNYKSDIRCIENRAISLESRLKEVTDIGVDVHYRDLNSVIVIGRYKNNDYVQCYHVGQDNIASLIDRLKEMERYANVRRIDSPPEFRAVLKNHIDF